jgi:hypothetical protein
MSDQRERIPTEGAASARAASTAAGTVARTASPGQHRGELDSHTCFASILAARFATMRAALACRLPAHWHNGRSLVRIPFRQL